MADREFATAEEARTYLDGIVAGEDSLRAAALIEAVERIAEAYREFPELALERSRREVANVLAVMAKRLPDNSEILARLDAVDGAALPGLRHDNIERVLSPGSSIADRQALEAVVQSAARRLRATAYPRSQDRSDELLGLANRLGAAPPSYRFVEQPLAARPFGTLSFDEFLLQWPCEIELPADLPDRDFVAYAYRAILLRPPGESETAECCRLLHTGTVSREWIIEHLLCSEELRALERVLRVKLGDTILVDPELPARHDMPALTWPRVPAR